MTAEEKDLMYELAKALNVPVHHFEEDAGYMDYINPYKILEFINQFKSDIEKNAYPNTFAKDGETEFCGKCGTAI